VEVFRVWLPPRSAFASLNVGDSVPRRFPIDGSFRRMLAVLGAAVTALAVTAALSGAAAAAPHRAPGRSPASRAPGRLMGAFSAAAGESGVPASLLLAIG
jgi:hypothetical protein